MNTYRLFKRDDKGREMDPAAVGYRERPYYFRFEFRGKRYPRCLETNDAAEAQTKARRLAETIRTAIIRDETAPIAATKLRQTIAARFADLTATYHIAPVDANADTRTQNIQAMELILRRVDGEINLAETIITQINGPLARRWFEINKQKAEAATDPDAQLSIKISANSRMAQARSLFAAKAVAAYKDAGCHHPCLDEFAKAFNLYKFSRLPERRYNAPPESIVEKTLDAWEKLEDRDLFLTIGHELSFGLRKGEMAQARWDWWKVRSGYPVLDGEAKVKNGSGLLQVRALDPFFSIMKLHAETRHWRPAADSTDYIIGGNNSNREEGVFREVGQWLRGLGWETNKTNHALRDYAGSQIAMKFGIYEAQTWLRHSTVTVTEKHYTDFVKRFKPADLDQIPVRWSTVQQTPTLRIVSAAG